MRVACRHRGAAGFTFGAASRLVLAVWMLAGAAACRRSAEVPVDESLGPLRAEVAELGARAAARPDRDVGLPPLDDAPDLVAVGLTVQALGQIVAAAASHYLAEVRLHLRINEVVQTGDVVRVRVGPVAATAGRWDLAVTIRRVDAHLSAGTIEVAPGDSNRIDLTVPVQVRDATGDALIDFRWDAARIAGVLCGDFHIEEAFSAYAMPGTFPMRGHIELVIDRGTMVARPVLRDRIFVSPRPTEESWQRIRAILREQDRIFNCGLAISPDRMERMLDDLLTRGFRFDLPSSVLRPMPLPGGLVNEVDVAGRRVAVSVVADPPRIREERLWMSARIQPTAIDDAPLRIDTGRGPPAGS